MILRVEEASSHQGVVYTAVTRIGEIELAIGKARLWDVGLEVERLQPCWKLSVTDLHKPDNILVTWESDVRVPDICEVRRSLRVLFHSELLIRYQEWRENTDFCSVAGLPKRFRHLRDCEVVKGVLTSHVSKRDLTATFEIQVTSSVLETCFEFVPLRSQTSCGI